MIGVGVLTLLAGIASLMFGLMLTEDRLIFFPSRGGVGSSPGDEVWLTSADGVSIHGWYLSHPAATHTLLHLHGNAGNLEDRRAILMRLRDVPLNVLAIDYRGYGRSSGTPSESGLYADTLAAYTWLCNRGPATNLIAYGESLGGGPATELAATQRIGALVLQSTFTNIADMAALTFPWLPVRWLLRTRFDNLAKLPRVSVPKLIIHSRSDELIPFSMAERLYRSAPAPRHGLWLDQSGHNELFALEAESVLVGLQRFIGTL
jgi:fermentation-respiration switch protein FrsA (DUF1100 family)